MSIRRRNFEFAFARWEYGADGCRKCSLNSRVGKSSLDKWNALVKKYNPLVLETV